MEVGQRQIVCHWYLDHHANGRDWCPVRGKKTGIKNITGIGIHLSYAALDGRSATSLGMRKNDRKQQQHK